MSSVTLIPEPRVAFEGTAETADGDKFYLYMRNPRVFRAENPDKSAEDFAGIAFSYATRDEAERIVAELQERLDAP